MKTSPWIKGLAPVLLALFCAVAARGEPVRIFAAASLQGALDDVAAKWDGDTVISYAGSGTIARQVSLGAPADVVVLASTDWMTWLEQNGHLAAPPRDIMGNQLVLIAPAGTPALARVNAAGLMEQLAGGRLAMGHRESVPAGQYASAWLRNIDAWDPLRTQLAETENVRAALAFVARGETPLGIVYATDAAASGAVSVIWEIAPDDHPAIRYPAAAITEAGVSFVDHLSQNRADFIAAGFTEVP